MVCVCFILVLFCLFLICLSFNMTPHLKQHKYSMKSTKVRARERKMCQTFALSFSRIEKEKSEFDAVLENIIHIAYTARGSEGGGGKKVLRVSFFLIFPKWQQHTDLLPEFILKQQIWMFVNLLGYILIWCSNCVYRAVYHLVYSMAFAVVTHTLWFGMNELSRVHKSHKKFICNRNWEAHGTYTYTRHTHIFQW